MALGTVAVFASESEFTAVQQMDVNHKPLEQEGPVEI